MTVALLPEAKPPAARAELVPQYFDTERIVTPDGNPVYSPQQLADLLESMREHGQLIPGWVYPSPDLPEDRRICLEGNRRFLVARQLGLRFWAFDLDRFVPEDERIRLTFQHNHSRRVMSRDEIAERAARYIDLTGCSAVDAARLLNVSEATLSRAFGERRIPPELKPRADKLGLSIRSLIAAAPQAVMEQAIAFAEAPIAGCDKKPTRDQVQLFIKQLKQAGKPKARKGRAVTLRITGRAVTLTVGEKDSAYTVAEDLKAIATKLGKHADVPPDGWPFLFQ